MKYPQFQREKGYFFMGEHKGRYLKPDYYLMILVGILLIVGIIMVYSSSYVWADYSQGDHAFFLKRQLLFVGTGVMAMFIMMNVPYHFLKKHVRLLLCICFLLLILVLIPGIGIVRGGARSWIGIGAFSIQPSEFMKMGLIIYLAAYLSHHQKQMKSFLKGFLPPILLVMVAFGCIMLQPDLGTGMVLVATCMLMIYVNGAKLNHFIAMLSVGLAGFIGLIASAPYRIKRITAFLNPWEDPLGDGFQIIQSLYAIGPGGLLGVGLGKSLQKYFYLPEPQTDFIFAILGEELGFIGGVIMLVLFALLFWRGTYIALLAPDQFSRLLALGIVFMLTIQVMINVSVVIGLIPVTGITLPFLSYGGSSLTLTLISVGILLNISKYTQM